MNVMAAEEGGGADMVERERLEWGKGRKGEGFLYAQERPSIAGSLIDLRHESKHDHDSP